MALIEHLVADSIAGSNDDPVATWTATVGNNATQGTAANRPLLKTATVNGHNAVLFDDLNDYLAFGTLGALTNWTIVAVAKPTATSTGTLFSQDNAGFNGDLLFGVDPEEIETVNSRWAVDVQTPPSTRTIVTDIQNVSTSVYVVLAGRYDGTNLKLFKDGVEVDSEPGTTLTLANQTWNIGRNPQGSRYYGGYIAEIRIYDDDLTDEVLSDTVMALGTTYDIATVEFFKTGTIASTADVATSVAGIEVPVGTTGTVSAAVDVATTIVGSSAAAYAAISSTVDVYTAIGGDAEIGTVTATVGVTVQVSAHLTPFPNPAAVGGGRFPIGVRRTT